MSNIIEDSQRKLLKAIRNGKVEKVKKLLENGVDIHFNNEDPLTKACLKGNTDIIKLLLSYGADLHYSNEYPLGLALKAGKEETIRFLIQAGAKIENLDLVFIDSDNLSAKFVQYLVDCGLKINIDILYGSIDNDRIEYFKIFYKKIPNPDIQSIFTYASKNYSFKIMDYLLDLEIDLDLSNPHLLSSVIRKSNITLFKKILNRVPDYNLVLGSASLQLACIGGSIQMVKILLELDLNPNKYCVNMFGSHYLSGPCIEIAVCTNKIEIVKELLKYGAVPTAKSLINSLFVDNEEICDIIYHAREWSNSFLSVKVQDMYGKNIELYTLKKLHERIKIQLKTDYLKNIIDYSLEKGNIEIIDYLIDCYGRETVTNLIDKSEDYSDHVQIYLEKL